MIQFFRDSVEKSIFGVCADIASYMGIRASRVRIYFIYLTFLTFGSPIIVYLTAAFWMNIKQYIRNGRNWLLD